MTDDSPAISVKGLSKKYRLFGSPKERLLEALHPFRKKYHREFWALQGVGFDVPKGATVGIVGRNGSGKSTLLQIISSVLRPTTGSVEVHGRISALLELGAGFNPELTGRENAVFGCELTGLSPKETTSRLPAIERFADIGQFMDQQVKTYSSGMFVRLAFACAINVHPDVLIIDEALAVGDAKFQHKCYDKLQELKDRNVTVLLVTHDVSAIVKLCQSAMLLEAGRVVMSGRPQDVVNHYLDLLFNPAFQPPSTSDGSAASASTREGHPGGAQQGPSEVSAFLAEVPSAEKCSVRKSYNKNEYRHGDRRAEIVDYLLVAGARVDPVLVEAGEVIDLYLKIRVREDVQFPHYGFLINSLDGFPVFGTNTTFMGSHAPPCRAAEIVTIKFSVRMSICSGDFFLDVGMAEVVNNNFLPVDRRCSMIHLQVRGTKRFTGYGELEVSVSEAARIQNPKPPSSQ